MTGHVCSNYEYQKGRRGCLGCNREHFLFNKRSLVHKAQGKTRRPRDAATTHQQLADLRGAGWGVCRVARAVGSFHQVVSRVKKQQQVGPDLAERIEALWRDVCGPVEADARRWPSEPLREALKAERGALDRLRRENNALYSYIYRYDTLDLDRADMAATKYLSGGPESVWGQEWFGFDEETA